MIKMEELKNINISALGNGRPADTLTDKKWQNEFEILKLYVTPSKKKQKVHGGKYSKDCGDDFYEEYKGVTNWQSYCRYINDVMRCLRNGEREYCYFKYQIIDLLKYYHDELRTKFYPDKNGMSYWEVWLER